MRKLLIMLNCAHRQERTAEMLSNTREIAVDNACLHTPQERAVDFA
jgi:hypothetical protein